MEWDGGGRGESKCYCSWREGFECGWEERRGSKWIGESENEGRGRDGDEGERGAVRWE